MENRTTNRSNRELPDIPELPNPDNFIECNCSARLIVALHGEVHYSWCFRALPDRRDDRHVCVCWMFGFPEIHAIHRQ